MIPPPFPLSTPPLKGKKYGLPWSHYGGISIFWPIRPRSRKKSAPMCGWLGGSSQIYVLRLFDRTKWQKTRKNVNSSNCSGGYCKKYRSQIFQISTVFITSILCPDAIAQSVASTLPNLIQARTWIDSRPGGGNRSRFWREKGGDRGKMVRHLLKDGLLSHRRKIFG